MFFLIGTWPGKKELGVIDGYTVYMVYESLMLFFIPIFKFGKRYFAEKGSSVYEIDKETGQLIERGEEVSLDFTGASSEDAGVAGGMAVGKICMRCGFKTDNREYTHCPMCGNLLVHDDGEGR